MLTEHHKEKEEPNHICHLIEKGKPIAVIGYIIEPVKEKKSSLKTVVDVVLVKIGSKWTETSGKLLCYFEKNKSTNNLTYSNRVLITSLITAVEPPKNPSEFDYKQYLAFHNIYHRTYIKQNEYEVVRGSMLGWFATPNLFLYYAQKIRGELERKLLYHFREKRESSIVQALILGMKDNLENEVIQAYSGVGAMHVLAVSGLHVGLVYKILLFFFSWLNRRNWKVGTYTQIALLVLAIWFYAFITGLSPSVMRAATMFSFIILGKATNRNSNIYNTLSISAFSLLCINPFMIMEVGFQLSYLAVIGIVYLHPKLYYLFRIENVVGDKIWEITCVSIAAQIGTFPLGLLYFHQFPTYFFISNLIVIPAAILILYWGFLILTFSWWESISETLTFLLEHIIWFINEAIFKLSELPYALLSEIDISILESWIIYSMLLFFILFFHYKKLLFFFYAFIGFAAFNFIQLNEFEEDSGKEEVIFYAVNKHLAIGLREANHLAFISDKKLNQKRDEMQFHIYHHWWKEDVTNVKELAFESLLTQKDISSTNLNGNVVLSWKGKTFLFYENPFHVKLEAPISIDYLIAHNNVWVDKELINHNLSFQHFIIDGTNNKRTANWIKKCFPLKTNNLVSNGYFLEII